MIPNRPSINEEVAQLYVANAASLLHLPLAPEHLPGVTDNFLGLCATAELLAGFLLPPELESAQVFEP